MLESRPQTHSPVKFFIWFWPVLVAASGLAGFALFLANAATPVPASWGVDAGARDGVVQWLNALQQSVVSPLIICFLGALILYRRRRHLIGRLLVALGAVSALAVFTQEWAVYGYYTLQTALPGAAVAAWITNWIWVVLFGLLIMTVALFPNGRFPSRAWGWLVSAALFFFTAPLLAGGMVETPMSSVFQIDNPFVTHHSQAFYDFVFALGVPAMLTAVLVALASAVVRFRRSQGRERQQMKWLLAGAALMALLTIVGLGIVFGLGNAYGGLLVNAALLGPMLGVSIALLRYQLYDIDIIIRRTLQYTLLTGLLALVYFGSVLLLQTLFDLAIGSRSPVIIVISTLTIAALFTPLRRRIQDTIDRRFFRKKYDAQQVLAQFAITARDETDLDALTGELQRVVQETLQPEGVGVWLKPTGSERGG